MVAFKSKLNKIDFSPIAFKLLSEKENAEWPRERVEDAVFWYKRFLYIVGKHPHDSLAPTFDIDTVWHTHILDTRKYISDCHFLFGHYLHHFPYLGLRGKEDKDLLLDSLNRTMQLFQAEFSATPGVEQFSKHCSGSCDSAQRIDTYEIPRVEFVMDIGII